MAVQGRRRVWRAWTRCAGGLLAALGVVVLALALAGLATLQPEASLSSRLYTAVRLYTLDGDFEGGVPWSLDVARWLAPLVTAGVAAEAVVAVARRRVSGWSARLLRDHLVVVGAGERGTSVALRAREAGADVVVIEADAAGPTLAVLRREGVPVVIGDASDPDRLRAAGLRRARRLVGFTGSSSSAIALSEALSRLRASRRADFEAFLELADQGLARELQTLVDLEGDAQQEFFDLSRRAGPILCDRFDTAAADGPGPPRGALVVGAGAEAMSVLATVAARWDAALRDVPETSGVRRVSVLVADGEDHREVERRVRASHPLYTRDEDARDGCAFSVETVDPVTPETAVDAALTSLGGPPGLVVVAGADDGTTLRMTSHLAERTEALECAVVLVTPGEGPASDMLARHLAGRVERFSVTDELCTEDLIAHGRVEELARELHNGYRRHLARSGDGRARPADVPWDRLEERYRRSNRAAAASLWRVLREEGYTVAPRRSDRPPRVLPPDVVERLAAAEHDRWRSDRPDVPGWADLDDFRREQSRDQVRRSTSAFAAVGLEVVPRRPERPLQRRP